ncbi:MAG TPA: glycosyltransferase [Sediminibacterium sp.]|nr:glycosyltransferase [Sediminibacterium sp.]
MITIFLSLTILGVAAYCLLIGIYRYWFLRLKIYRPSTALSPRTRFTIIIPARNEASSIVHCLNSIHQLDYPKNLLEVIVVNDHSTDGTPDIVLQRREQFTALKLINLADHLNGAVNAYKKRAIEIAVAESSGNWIVTTDADCIVPQQWLLLFDQYIQEHQPVFVAAPVMFTLTKSWLGVFQVLDFMSLQGITAAAVAAGYHSMCNGANLAYSRSAFEAVDGFRGIDHIASGDDMLLMYKIKQRFPGKLGFLFSPEAIVQTAPMPDWGSFLNQRIRWASKADSYSEKSIFRVLFLVYCVNALLLTGLLLGLFFQGFYPRMIYLLIAKTVMELLFMWPVAGFFHQRKSLFFFPFMQPFHLIYTVVAGWLGKFGTYRWKGRSVH